MIDPMSPLDSIFLLSEDGVTHMHIGSCAIFEGPCPPIGDVISLVESKLPLLHRYRQKVRFVPGGLGLPVWVDDPDFDIGYHVRHSALPRPGDEHELENLMGRLMSQELDRSRPLWEDWVVEGLAGDRWALISKVHHCMVDGISGTDLMSVLLDRDQTTATRATQAWTPAPEPSDVQLTLEAMTRLALSPIRQFRAWWSAGMHPRQTLSRLGEVATGIRSFSKRISPMKPLSIEGIIGPHRRWAAGRSTLDEVKTIRSTLGGSVNDVLLAAISGAFRTVLLERGDQVDDHDVLRSLVPVSVRQADDHTLNNQVSLIIAELPIGIADPLARLEAVCAQMTVLKASHQATAGAAVVTTAAFLPPVLLALATRSAMSVLRTSSQQTVNTVTTNVPGPQYPLYALGREMLDYLPFVPLSQGVRIGVAITSYNGQLFFGITGDYDTAPDAHFMAHQIEDEIKSLGKLATHHRTVHPS